ncbi:MAG TPA: hypothetical protein PL189_13485, partial [bacterium]|nr:hypothetical protein [bacterium]
RFLIFCRRKSSCQILKNKFHMVAQRQNNFHTVAQRAQREKESGIASSFHHTTIRVDWFVAFFLCASVPQ